MYRQRSGPPPLLIFVLGMFIVFGGYYIWIGLLDFLENEGNITAEVTRAAYATATARSVTQRPTIFVPATYTPLPPCQMFQVNVERAVYRECPSRDNIQCPAVDTFTYGQEVCVYARAPENPEWYVIDLNPGGAFRDIVYMHESVIEPVNPTLTPSPTYTPLPTISPTPSYTPLPTIPVSPTATPDPALSPAPTPTLTPSPTPPRVMI